MTQILFTITEYNIVNNTIEPKPSISLKSVRELKDLIANTFPDQKTYQTGESDSNESLIKSTTDETKILHMIENID